jgi:tetratricopeptide (TPR) repeat protein
MFTQDHRPGTRFFAAAILVVAAIAFLFWRFGLPQRKSSVENANRYLPDRANLPVKPGASAEAQALYLRARELETHENRQDLLAARDLYQDAIALDPAFALARARLSMILSTSGADNKRARAEAEEALRLEPQLGEAHFALGVWFDENGDAPSALSEIEIAAGILPDDFQIIYRAATLHRRQGKWKQSLEEFQKAVALNPRHSNGPTDLAWHLSLLRDWKNALPTWDRALAIVPESMFNRVLRSYADVWATGDLIRGKALLASVPPDYPGQAKEFLAWMRWDFNLLLRDFDAADQAVTAYEGDTISGGWFGSLPKTYLRGAVKLARGDSVAAMPLLAEACKFFEKGVQEHPDFPEGHAQLGLAYAYMGRRDEAIREGLRSVELSPESKDAYAGTRISTALAVIYARTGERDKAIAEVERLLILPGALNYECSITLNDLKLRWQWDPLRSDPRFQAIVNGPEPATVVR